MTRNIIVLHTTLLENDFCFTILLQSAKYYQFNTIKKIQRKNGNKNTILKSNITTIVNNNNEKITLGHHIGTVNINIDDNIRKIQIYNYPQYSEETEPSQIIFIPKKKLILDIPIFVETLGPVIISSKILYKQFN
jgi:hypothetical protein